MIRYFRLCHAVRPPLRIGLLLDTAIVSAFCAGVIEDVRCSNFARIELVAFRKSPAKPVVPNPSASLANKLARRLIDPKLRKHILYNAYLQLDRRKKPANHPLDPVDCSAQLAGIDSIEVEPIGQNFVQRFPDVALEKLRSKNLDVLLRFGFNILHGGVLQAARFGVWSYHHGDNDFYRGGPSHFWELYERNPLSGVILQVLTEELDGGLVLCKSFFPTEKTISVSRNRFAPYWGSTDLMISKLNELHQYGWEHVQARALPGAPYQGRRKIYRIPTNADMVRWLGPVFLKKTVQHFFHQKQAQH